MEIAIIAAGLAALINCVFQLINKMIDLSKEKHSDQENKKQKYKEKKEEVYIAALDRLLFIRRGLDITHDQLLHDKRLREMFDEGNISFISNASKLRLYANDKIYNKYRELSGFARYAYAPSRGPRLIENSKWAYDAQVMILARQMQADLKIREYNDNFDMIQCPDCMRMHDLIAKCKCGMTFEQLQIKISEILLQAQEFQNDINENDESGHED